MYVVYVLKSKRDGNLYVGCTSNLEKRYRLHSGGLVRSTKHRRPLEIVYKETYDDRAEAYLAERYYKTAKGKRELRDKITQFHCRLV